MQLTLSRPRKVVRTSFKSMWHRWFNRNFMKLREYFLCAKKTKIMTLFYNFFSSSSILNVSSGEQHKSCVCIPLLVNKPQCMRVLCQQHHTHASLYCHECAAENDMGEKNCWIKSFVGFVCVQKVFSYLHKMTAELLCLYYLSVTWTW